MINHHLNRQQRRYLAKAVGAKTPNESFAQKFARIRTSQYIGKQIHMANVESQQIIGSDLYNNPQEHERTSDLKVDEMLQNSTELTSDQLGVLGDLGFVNDAD